MPSPAPSKSTPKPLTATHRCDRCSAAATYRVLMPKKPQQLLFCSHHYGEARPHLPRTRGIKIYNAAAFLVYKN